MFGLWSWNCKSTNYKRNCKPNWLLSIELSPIVMLLTKLSPIGLGLKGFENLIEQWYNDLSFCWVIDDSFHLPCHPSNIVEWYQLLITFHLLVLFMNYLLTVNNLLFFRVFFMTSHVYSYCRLIITRFKCNNCLRCMCWHELQLSLFFTSIRIFSW